MYEWDETKRRVNLAKHDVDFGRVIDFEWDSAVIDPETDRDEPRWTAKGFIGPVLYVVVYTERGENLRIISLRKATRREALRYAEKQE